MRASRRAGVTPSRSEVHTSPNVLRILRVLPMNLFEYMFPRANEGRGTADAYAPYTYNNFLKAASMWPRFCDESDAAGLGDLDILCKRELGSMFAHFAQEVGEHNHEPQYELWRQGLYHFTEMGCSDDPSLSGCEYTGVSCDSESWQDENWRCREGVKYFGRGAKQLSYNYNYGPFSNAVFGDVNTLLQAPWSVVAKDAEDGKRFLVLHDTAKSEAVDAYLDPKSRRYIWGSTWRVRGAYNYNKWRNRVREFIFQSKSNKSSTLL